MNTKPLTMEQADEIIQNSRFDSQVEDYEFNEKTGDHIYTLEDGNCVTVRTITFSEVGEPRNVIQHNGRFYPVSDPNDPKIGDVIMTKNDDGLWLTRKVKSNPSLTGWFAARGGTQYRVDQINITWRMK